MGREGDEVDGDRNRSKPGGTTEARIPGIGGNHCSGGSTKKRVRGHQRTRDIKRAIKEAKKRDGYRCRHCGETPVHGAHLIPRNVSVPEYHPANPDWIVTLCGKCHYVFDSGHTVKAKLKCAKAFGLDREAKMLKILVDKGW